MNPPRRDLFARFSGTSMATPIVAGAVALVIGLLRLEGRPTDPTAVRQYLLQNCVSSVPHSHMVVGRGRLDMSRA
jgi:subtilisin family serine protease